jgi:hypothetical protein
LSTKNIERSIKIVLLNDKMWRKKDIKLQKLETISTKPLIFLHAQFSLFKSWFLRTNQTTIIWW